MTGYPRFLPAALGILLSAPLPAAAAVDGAGDSGFSVTETAHIAASPDQVYATLIVPSKWWNSAHTFSQDAANLTLDAKAGGCWCETLPNGGSVMHMTVVYVAPGKALRLRGALGPFQGMGVDGAMTVTLKPAGDGTDVTMTYAMGGYAKGGFADLAKAADAVLGEQLGRLAKAVSPH
jgi:uncharacterized protein YndB with AHSA1/START domain